MSSSAHVLLVVDNNQNFGPGFIGFAVLFLMAVAVYFLLRDMTKRMRRLRYNAEAKGELPTRRIDLPQGREPNPPPPAD